MFTLDQFERHMSAKIDEGNSWSYFTADHDPIQPTRAARERKVWDLAAAATFNVTPSSNEPAYHVAIPIWHNDTEFNAKIKVFSFAAVKAIIAAIEAFYIDPAVIIGYDFKTNLDRRIDTEQQAAAYLKELAENGEAYDPDTSAHRIVWHGYEPTDDEKDKLDDLMKQVHATGVDVYDILLNSGR